MRIGVVASLIGALLVVNQGFAQFAELTKYQPDKLKTMAVGPPLGIMIMLGFLMLLCAILGAILLIRNWITKARFLHVLMVGAIRCRSSASAKYPTGQRPSAHHHKVPWFRLRSDGSSAGSHARGRVGDARHQHPVGDRERANSRGESDEGEQDRPAGTSARASAGAQLPQTSHG